ncbi:MAG: SPOR domain-containing protein [Chromatiales bacterium]|jgi:cell division protein FtsN
MPRDYKNHARSNTSNSSRKRRKSTGKKKKQQTPGWIWFLAGILLGTGAFLLYLYLEKQQVPSMPVPVVTDQKPVTPARPAEKKPEPPVEEKPHHPQFEFYSVLPEMEVEVPPDTLRPSAGVARVPTSSTGIYQLQIASYRSSGDAERMKASLALKGISARVEKVSVNDKTYYRVRSGPYNRDQAYSLHTKLKSNNIDSLVIQIKK